jgi:hypothetical protein
MSRHLLGAFEPSFDIAKQALVARWAARRVLEKELMPRRELRWISSISCCKQPRSSCSFSTQPSDRSPLIRAIKSFLDA